MAFKVWLGTGTSSGNDSLITTYSPTGFEVGYPITAAGENAILRQNSLFQSALLNVLTSNAALTTTADSSQAQVVTELTPLIKTTFLNSLYPINSIYMSVNSTSPASIFGGTWTQIKDTFLLAAGDNYAGGSTGGEAAHTLTFSETPFEGIPTDMSAYGGVSVTGNYFKMQDNPDINGWTPTLGTAWNGWKRDTSGVEAHNNMPPYLTVYIWKRVS